MQRNSGKTKLKKKRGLEDVKSNGRKLKYGTVKDKFRCAVPVRHKIACRFSSTHS